MLLNPIMRNGWMYQVMAGMLLATGCSAASNDEGSQANPVGCEPGMPVECACAAGQPGTQLCNESGTALLACECGSSPGTGGLPPVSGTGGAPPVSGTGGAPPVSGTGGTPPVSGTGGTPPVSGTGGAPPVTGTGGMPPEMGTGGEPPVIGSGTCCSDGDCLCHGPDPTGLTSSNGPFNTASYTISTGTVYYPTDAEPPFAGVALCGGFLNTGPEMETWGPFYASYGIVTVITTTTGADFPDVRATKLLAAVDELKGENGKAGSPLSGKLAGRYGTSGYSMGGGGTTIASGQAPTLRTSVGLAPWGPDGNGVQVPTLLLCGDADTVAPCTQAQGAYTNIPNTTPKMMMSIPGTTHFNWFSPTDAGGGMSGETALAFQKVYLEGDERWKPFLLQGRGSAVTTNIQ